jgi:hypothetical protein
MLNVSTPKEFFKKKKKKKRKTVRANLGRLGVLQKRPISCQNVQEQDAVSDDSTISPATGGFEA